MFHLFKSNNQFDGKNIYNFSARNSNGENIPMQTYLGKVLLIVNVASQYSDADSHSLSFPTTGLVDENFKQLAELDKRYRSQGLVILGFPTNQFGGKEPALQQEIVSQIQRKYPVNFEIFEKVNCNGVNTLPLFEYLKTVLPGTLTNDLKWHFTKFLVDRNGNPVRRYAPNESPISFEEEIIHLLRQPASLAKGFQDQSLPTQNFAAQPAFQRQSANQPLVRDQWNATHPGMMETTLEKGKDLTAGLKKGLESTFVKGKELVGQAAQKWNDPRDLERDRAYWIGIEQDRLRIQREIGLGKPGMYNVPRQKTMMESTKEGLKSTLEKGKALVGQAAQKWNDPRDLERDRAYWIGIEQDRLKIQREIGLGKPGMYKVPKQKTMMESTKEGLKSTLDKGKALVGQAAQKWNDPRDIDRDRAYWVGIEQDRLRIQREGGLGKGPGYKIQKKSVSKSYYSGPTGVQWQQEPVQRYNIERTDKYTTSMGAQPQAQAKGFSKQPETTGEGGKIGAQMGVHIGHHTFQAGVQAGKDPQKK